MSQIRRLEVQRSPGVQQIAGRVPMSCHFCKKNAKFGNKVVINYPNPTIQYPAEQEFKLCPDCSKNLLKLISSKIIPGIKKS